MRQLPLLEWRWCRHAETDPQAHSHVPSVQHWWLHFFGEPPESPIWALWVVPLEHDYALFLLSMTTPALMLDSHVLWVCWIHCWPDHTIRSRSRQDPICRQSSLVIRRWGFISKKVGTQLSVQNQVEVSKTAHEVQKWDQGPNTGRNEDERNCWKAYWSWRDYLAQKVGERGFKYTRGWLQTRGRYDKTWLEDKDETRNSK